MGLDMDFFDQDSFDLAAGISAAQLACMQRRIRYLEAALAQVTGCDRALREWFSAAELVRYGLPGLPVTASGLTRHARAHEWEYRVAPGPRGERMEYHFTSLPQHAFDEMLARILRSAAQVHDMAELVPNIPRPARPSSDRRRSEPTPQWLLPLMRILRQKPMPIGQAVKLLPPDIATGHRPDIQEVVQQLREIGLLVG